MSKLMRLRVKKKRFREKKIKSVKTGATYKTIVISPKQERPERHTPTAPKPPTRPQVTIDGMVYTNDSFAVVSRGLAIGLLQNGVDVSIEPWPEGSRTTPVHDEVKRAVKTPSRREIGVRVSHPNSFSALSSFKYRIGKAYFETNKFPEKWVRYCNKYCDQVWVSSSFNKKVCERSGVENVYVVHDGYDPKVFKSSGDVWDFGLPNSTFKFLTVGNSQKRKGTDLLYQAFTEEFDEKENVALIYKTYAGWATGAKKYQKKDKILHIDADIPYHKMGSLYRAADCFVLPTRGEGAGICCLEAMACGVPVITTNWSAQLDYCDNQNSFLIEPEGFEPAFEGKNWQGYWAVPSKDQLKFLMRHVYEHPEVVRTRVERALSDAKKFIWKKCARQAVLYISLLIPEVFNALEVLNC